MINRTIHIAIVERLYKGKRSLSWDHARAVSAENTSPVEEISKLNQRILFGSYPDVVNNPGYETEILNELCTSYLFKDVFTLYDIRKPEVIEKLLTALALQISSKVSYNELAQLLNSDVTTIERYTRILERAFIVFRLPNFSTNQRTCHLKMALNQAGRAIG